MRCLFTPSGVSVELSALNLYVVSVKTDGLSKSPRRTIERETSRAVVAVVIVSKGTRRGAKAHGATTWALR